MLGQVGQQLAETGARTGVDLAGEGTAAGARLLGGGAHRGFLGGA